MRDELPPTAGLRAFCVVAETLSIKQAARELALSPSAVSRQIQGLEEHLGVPLLRRLNPGLELTAAGLRYRGRVEEALAVLRAAQRSVAPQPSGPLRVSALESFSAKWLIPNLPGFEAVHPGVELEIEATLRYADFDRDPVDVAIRFGEGPWDGLHSEPLVDLDFFPVCSPALAAGEPGLREPRDLAAHTCIGISQTPEAWRGWLERAGLAGLEPRRRVVYDHVEIALSAAVSGQGVALSTEILCAPELADGRLVAPFPLRTRSASTYHLVCREEGLGDPRIVALRDWLVAALA
jgi:LysR family glycine cleavage system transcriptional activator